VSDPEVVAVAASPLRMLGDASVPVCVDDACILPGPSNAEDDTRG
jgi:hypothetical protein